MWTGAYEFKSELKDLLKAFKEQLEFILNKIEETDKKLD